MDETVGWLILTRGIVNEMKRRGPPNARVSETVYCGMCGKDISDETRYPEIDVYTGGNTVLRVVDSCYKCGSPFFYKKSIAEAVEWAQKSENIERIKVKIEQCKCSIPLETHAPPRLFTYVDYDGKEVVKCDCGTEISAFDD